MAHHDNLDHRCIYSDAQDPTSMTIEFLRARLLAERAISKSARAKLDGLADKVADLEEELKIVSLQRKKVEQAPSHDASVFLFFFYSFVASVLTTPIPHQQISLASTHETITTSLKTSSNSAISYYLLKPSTKTFINMVMKVYIIRYALTPPPPHQADYICIKLHDDRQRLDIYQTRSRGDHKIYFGWNKFVRIPFQYVLSLFSTFGFISPQSFLDQIRFQKDSQIILIEVLKVLHTCSREVSLNKTSKVIKRMTVEKGIIHSEMPKEEVNNGIQLSINLPSSEKMIEPKSLEMSNLDIPQAEENGVEVKVIAGDSMGIKSPILKKTPNMFLDFTLKPGSQTHQAVPESWTTFAYIIEGDEGFFSSSDSNTISVSHVLLLVPRDLVSVWNKSTSTPLRILLFAGEPIGESVVQDGSLVMNSHAEIDMALEDYQNAKNGFEMAKSWKSL